MRKRRRKSRQAGIRKASVSKPLMKHRKIRDGIKTGACVGSREESGGCPVYWPGGVRCEGGASLICGFCMELGKAGADNATSCLKMVRGGKRERARQQKLLGAEYRCGACWRTGSY
jgi:hypothetical protein